ncbi:hypothetical protein PBAC_19520 [Pedobacter glucosidilyticus]|nr:hypothetical protein [Pedobacter glucosidilyticus]KHJ37792.1 hypothetical protein PBAC_19520 [Pedobacter glucosidilyticus]
MIKRHKNIELLKELFSLPNFDESNFAHWEQLHQLSVQAIINNGGALPIIPPLEKHPYLEPLDADTTATGLMIGTFPPITYLCSQFNLANLTYTNQAFTAPDLDYFHGNYSSLWKYAPIGFNQIQLVKRGEQPQMIIDALNVAGILYTDIIKYTQRKLNDNKYDAGDKNLTSIIPNPDIFNLLFNSQSINRIYFTNASFFVGSNPLFNKDGTLNLKENDAFGLFIKAALDEGINIQYQLLNSKEWIEVNENVKTTQQRRLINNQLKTKVVLKLKLIVNDQVKIFQICSCASPAAVNRNVHSNPCCIKYGVRRKVEGVERATGLLRKVLDSFFADNLNTLADYNA